MGERNLVEGPFPVVPVRRMADVVRQTGQVHQVGSQPNPMAIPSPDLGDPQVCQPPGPRVSLSRGPTTCVLSGQPAQRRTVQHPRAVPGEVAAGPVSEPGFRRSGPSATSRSRSNGPYPPLLVAHHRAPVARVRRPFNGPCRSQPLDCISCTSSLLPLLLVVLLTGLLSAPAAVAEPPFRVQQQVTDNAGVLSGCSSVTSRPPSTDCSTTGGSNCGWSTSSRSTTSAAGLVQRRPKRLSDLGTDDALLAIATQDRSFAFNVDPR